LPLCRSTANKRYTDFRPFGGGVNSPCRNAEGTAFPPLPQSPDDAAARPFERRAGEHFSEVKTIKKVIRFLYDIVQYFIRKFDEHAVGAFSAQASFFTIISFFPFVMLLMALLKQLPFSTDELFVFSQTFFPKSFSDFFQATVTEIPTLSSGAIISISAVTALWSASRGVYSIVSGLNSVYDVQETRSYIKTRLLALFYTFSFLIILVALLLVLVFGNGIYDWLIETFPRLERLAFVVISMRFVVSLAVLSIFFTLLYKFLPARKTKLLYEFPGATLAAIGWIGFSFLYSLYVDRAASNTIYGSLTTVVFLMLWLYACMYIVFFGAEVNALLFNNKLFEKYKEEKAKRARKDKDQ